MPRILSWSQNLPLDELMVRLGSVQDHSIVRITGGCADMSDDDAQGLLEMFEDAFCGYAGALLIGGTRMIRNRNPDDVIFGITEVGPAIKRVNPSSFVLGVVPRCPAYSFQDGQLIVYEEERGDDGKLLTTVIHPDQDVVVTVLTQLSGGDIWRDEVHFCQYITRPLVDIGKWNSLLVVCNGGATTRYEVLEAVKRGWPVLLIEDSGRECDELIAELSGKRSNVATCKRDAQSLQQALERHSVL